MSYRVTDQQVRDIVDTNPALPTLPFIAAANALTDKVSSNDSDSLLNAASLLEIERWLSAGLYAIRDQAYTSKKSGDASAVFQTGMSQPGFLNQNDYLRTAMALDVTGYLAKLNRGQTAEATMEWVGLAPSEQTDYEDRD